MLVVDDERPVLQTLGAMLTSAGYKVVCVPSGEGALAAARLTAFDGALIDIYMPEMNGFETAIKLREQSAKRGRTILLWHMTGMNNPEVEARSADCKIVGLLHKPFNLAVLCRTLEAGFEAAVLTSEATPPLDPKLTTDTPAADLPPL
jgi:CheY-like chemotaxis protein